MHERPVTSRSLARNHSFLSSRFNLRGVVPFVMLLAAVLLFCTPAYSTTIALAPLKTNSMFAKFGEQDYINFRTMIRDALAADDRVAVRSLEDVDTFAASKGMTTADGCFTLDCMLELGQSLGTDLVVAVSLNGELRSSLIQYEVRVLDVAQGRVVEREFGSGSETYSLPKREVRETARELVSRHLSPKALLTVKTNPAESAVLLNNNPVGFAPLTIERPSGLTDTVTVVRHGYVN